MIETYTYYREKVSFGGIILDFNKKFPLNLDVFTLPPSIDHTETTFVKCLGHPIANEYSKEYSLKLFSKSKKRNINIAELHFITTPFYVAQKYRDTKILINSLIVVTDDNTAIIKHAYTYLGEGDVILARPSRHKHKGTDGIGIRLVPSAEVYKHPPKLIDEELMDKYLLGNNIAEIVRKIKEEAFRRLKKINRDSPEYRLCEEIKNLEEKLLRTKQVKIAINNSEKTENIIGADNWKELYRYESAEGNGNQLKRLVEEKSIKNPEILIEYKNKKLHIACIGKEVIKTLKLDTERKIPHIKQIITTTYWDRYYMPISPVLYNVCGYENGNVITTNIKSLCIQYDEVWLPCVEKPNRKPERVEMMYLISLSKDYQDIDLYKYTDIIYLLNYFDPFMPEYIIEVQDEKNSDI